MISNRTKASLILYLSLHQYDFLSMLFDRTGIPYSLGIPLTDSLRSTVEQDKLLELLSLMVRTKGDLRNRISPRYRHDERWEDLVSCLQLDGYKIDGANLTQTEPSIEGVVSPEDELTDELRLSHLPDSQGILTLLEASATDFRKSPPDYNGCLSNARVALETTARSIAKEWSKQSQDKWGSTIAYLKTSGIITDNDESGLTGIYRFVSPGAHRPVGLSEQEMARLGRSMVVSMCFFLIKLHNAKR